MQLKEVDGYNYVITAIDYFTKYIELKALHTKTADEVGLFLYELICRYGCTSVIINDQGREFSNDLTKRLYLMTGTRQRVTSA